MIKGLLNYKSRNIKYKVYMIEKENDVYFYVKTIRSWRNIFTNTYIIDKFTYEDYCENKEVSYGYYNQVNTYRDIEYNVKKNEFINKCVGFSNTIIISLAEDIIKREIDKNKNVDIDNFNKRECCERDKIIKRLYDYGK